MENQITLSAHKIIDKFMKYAWNFSSVKIGNHYAPECLKATTVPEHLAEKFKQALYIGYTSHCLYLRIIEMQ